MRKKQEGWEGRREKERRAERKVERVSFIHVGQT